MKITLHIEVASAEELSTIAEALGGVTSAEVTHEVDTETSLSEPQDPKPAKTTKKASGKRGGKTTKPAEEEYETVESPFNKSAADVMDVEPPAAPLVAEVQQAPVQQQAPLLGQNPVEVITTEARRLEGATSVPKEAKQNLINSLLIEIGAPQGVRASQLPEPFLSTFATKFGPKVDAVIAQFSNAALV